MRLRITPSTPLISALTTRPRADGHRPEATLDSQQLGRFDLLGEAPLASPTGPRREEDDDEPERGLLRGRTLAQGAGEGRGVMRG